MFPTLEQNYNPNIKEVLINFADNITTDYEFLSKISHRYFKNASKKKKGQIAINLERFKSLKKAVQKMVMREAIKELKGDLKRIDYRHWRELEDLVSNRVTGAVVDLPGGIYTVKKREELIFFVRT